MYLEIDRGESEKEREARDKYLGLSLSADTHISLEEGGVVLELGLGLGFMFEEASLISMLSANPSSLLPLRI